MATGNHLRHTLIGIVEETVAGTTPASAMQLLNVGGNPNPTRSRTVEAPQILSNNLRGIPSQVLQSDGSWSIPATPMQYRNFLNFYEGIFGNDEGAAVSISGTGISAATNAVADTGNGLATVLSGDWVYMTDGNAGADFASAWFGPVTSGATAGSFSLPAGQMPNFSAGNTVTIKTRRLVDGSLTKTYSIEQQLTKLTTVWRNSVYAFPTSMSWAWSQGAYATEAVTIASQQTNSAAATIGTGTATAALATDYMNATSHVAGIDGAPTGGMWISTTAGTNLVATATTISSLGLTINRNNSIERSIGSVGLTGEDIGEIDATIDVTVILNDTTKALLTGMDAHSTYSLGWAVVDAQGNRACFSFPATKCVSDITISDADNKYVLPIQFKSHDPLRDTGSEYIAAGFSHEMAMFHVPA